MSRTTLQGPIRDADYVDVPVLAMTAGDEPKPGKRDVGHVVDGSSATRTVAALIVLGCAWAPTAISAS